MADSVATLVGMLVADPTVRYTGGGRAAGSFRIAINKRWKDNDDKWQEKTSFMECSVFGTLAENVASSCVKGTRVVVTGTIDQHEWEEDDGGKRSKIVLVADEVGPALRWATCEVTKNPRKDQG